jgi:DNA-directed RNA polymerase specialized sigma24 family protein
MTSSAYVRDLECVYREHYARFVRVAAAITGDEAGGADAVQEAFVSALKDRKSFRGEAPLEAWVWRIVVNAALAARITPEQPVTEVPAEPVGNGAHPDDPFSVRRWIAALPERQRLAVFLRYFADLDYRAIAAALEIEVGTVSATLSQAHTALRRSLQEVQK